MQQIIRILVVICYSYKYESRTSKMEQKSYTIKINDYTYQIIKYNRRISTQNNRSDFINMYDKNC